MLYARLFQPAILSRQASPSKREGRNMSEYVKKSDVVLALTYVLTRWGLTPEEIREVFSQIDLFDPKLGLELQKKLLPSKNTIN
jgi:hypothetical protein